MFFIAVCYRSDKRLQFYISREVRCKYEGFVSKMGSLIGTSLFLGIPERLSRKNAHTVTVLFLLKSPVVHRWIQNCEVVFQLVSNFAILDQEKKPTYRTVFTFIIINALRGEMKISTVSVL